MTEISELTRPVAEPDPAPVRPIRRRRNKTVVAMVVAAVGLIAVATTIAFTMWLAANDDKYLPIGTTGFTDRPGYAVIAPGYDSSLPKYKMVGSVRLIFTATPGKSQFVGVAPTAEVEKYLANIEHTEVHDASPKGTGHLPTRPADAPLWTQKAEGPGMHTIVLNAPPGQWSAVVMNADGTPSVSGHLTVSVTMPGLPAIFTGLTVAAIALLAGAELLSRKARREAIAG